MKYFVFGNGFGFYIRLICDVGDAIEFRQTNLLHMSRNDSKLIALTCFNFESNFTVSAQ